MAEIKYMTNRLMEDVQSMLPILYITKLYLTFNIIEPKEDNDMRKQAIEKLESAINTLLNIITEINLTLIGFDLEKEKIKSMLNKAYMQTAAAFGSIPYHKLNEDWLVRDLKAFETLYNRVLSEV